MKCRWCVIILILVMLRTSVAVIAYRYHSTQQNLVKPHIVFNSVMKCGSTYVVKTLQSNLDYKLYSHGKFTNIINLNNFFMSDKKIVKLHIMPNQLNLKDYKKYSNKIIFQLRDPREVVLSKVHHLNGNRGKSSVPDQYYSLSFKEQIDWVIEHQLPGVIKMINDWLVFKVEQEKINGIEVLITNYEELLNNETALLERILAFYQIHGVKLSKSLPKDKQVRFRKGDPNEWRNVFTPEQKHTINSMIPQHLISKFNWPE